MALAGGCVAPRNYHSAAIKWPEMIRVVLTDEAYDAIASTLPKAVARRPLQRDRGQCFIQVEAAVVDRMRAMRRPGESYRDVISGSSNSRRGGGGPEVTAKHDARSDRRGAADGPRVEAPRCAPEELL